MADLKQLRLNPEFPWFTWIAEHEDGSFLREYDLNGTQHLLKEIDESKLAKFIIENANEQRCWVDLKTGEFNLFGLSFFSKTLPTKYLRIGTSDEDEIHQLKLPDQKYRYIWFKRHTRVANINEELSHLCQYVFGVQITHEDKNYKQLFWIQENGTVLINGEQ